VNIYWVGFQD